MNVTVSPAINFQKIKTSKFMNRPQDFQVIQTLTMAGPHSEFASDYPDSQKDSASAYQPIIYSSPMIEGEYIP